MLAVSGLLNAKIGGPPVRVPIEPEVYDLIFTEGEPDNLWPLSPDKSEHYRRSLYLLNKRTVRLPMLANFDQPDDMTSCPVRPASTHSLQALSLMNSDFMQETIAGFREAAGTAVPPQQDLRGETRLQPGAGAGAQTQELEMARQLLPQGPAACGFLPGFVESK